MRVSWVSITGGITSGDIETFTSHLKDRIRYGRYFENKVAWIKNYSVSYIEEAYRIC